MLLDYSDKVSPIYGQHLKEDCAKRTKSMKIGEAVEKVVRRAWRENRLVVGVLEVATFLQHAVRGSALVCVLEQGPRTSVGDLCQHRLVEAFCREHRIRLVKVNGERSLMDKDDDEDDESEFTQTTDEQTESQSRERETMGVQLQDVHTITTKGTKDNRRRNSLQEIIQIQHRQHPRRIARNHSFPKREKNQVNVLPSSGNATCFLVQAEGRISSEEDFVIAFHDIYRSSSMHGHQFPCVKVGC
ncbi:hypothetical protein MAR_036884 [Mya arenaria]|uniref:Uncharacterized protein n=1 Tax=Mya arenaria TaxID=6604 RepID=A0ABY7FLW8_MYAAR|nr:uncharacterized protein LOC128213945 [Mya arenaria]WAR23215.1 hypothetical protein MAR_036884 [Mya arenaria]